LLDRKVKVKISLMDEDVLLKIQKPARYIGRELNIANKDFNKAEVRFALCFPGLYEVGMSNLGLRIIYGILNDLSGVSCERFFAPAPDMENVLRTNKIQISSLESGRNIKEFDFVGFSLGYELNYTDVLNILDLGLIPLKASLRDRNYPLVIGGGSCVLNPEPMSDFFDMFLIGEAEEAICEVIDIYRKNKERFKSGRMSKEDLLFEFCRIKGIYVPSLYEVIKSHNGKIQDFRPKLKGVPLRIEKRFVRDLDNSYFPRQWLLPYIQIVHDRITLEIMRGCPNACRFCQAKFQYHPFRQRGVASILNLAEDIYKRTGYEEISLCGLSVSDYPHIEYLVESLIALFKPEGISISLPSIKPKFFLGNLSSLIATIKKTGLTFAPEAGTERLRRIINKNFNIDNFLKTIEQSYSCGYQRVKLYFMIGLPGETKEDLDGIIDLANYVSEIRRKFSKQPGIVNISVNALIPKPHTPFQWLAMEDIDNIRVKQNYLRGKAKNKRLKLNFHNPQMSFLEGVLSRGDRALGEVILRVFQDGIRFDNQDFSFVFQKWMDAFSIAGINPGFYLQQRLMDEILPWDFIDIGVDKKDLIDDFSNCHKIK